MTRRPLAIANWKMHKTWREAEAWVREYASGPPLPASGEAAVAPPFTLLREMSSAIEGSPLALAAQDLHWEHQGPYTGEISAPMLAAMGVRYVLCGHSERRAYFGDTDHRVALKAAAAIASGLVPVVCVGETEAERAAGRTELVLEGQLRAACTGLDGEPGAFVVAYEPVWAIGTGNVATGEQIDSAHRFIRRILEDATGAARAAATRILYGGSVQLAGLPEILQADEVDGCLVGGASLSGEGFREIVAAVARG